VIEAALPGARVLFTDRALGDVREARGLSALEQLAGRPLARGAQVHGAVVRRVGTLDPGPGEADGQATALGGLAVMVQVADCLPVAVAGPGAVAMLHAGWRGLAGGVLEEGVAALRELAGDGPLAAVIGPGARGCCYEVGDEVRAAFGATGRTIDLPTLAVGGRGYWGRQVVRDLCGWLAILANPRRYASQVLTVEAASYLMRMAVTATFMFAYDVPVSVRAVLLIIAVNSISSTFAATPGGVGTQQALAAAALRNYAPASVVTA